MLHCQKLRILIREVAVHADYPMTEGAVRRHRQQDSPETNPAKRHRGSSSTTVVDPSLSRESDDHRESPLSSGSRRRPRKKLPSSSESSRGSLGSGRHSKEPPSSSESSRGSLGSGRHSKEPPSSSESSRGSLGSGRHCKEPPLLTTTTNNRECGSSDTEPSAISGSHQRGPSSVTKVHDCCCVSILASPSNGYPLNQWGVLLSLKFQ